MRAKTISHAHVTRERPTGTVNPKSHPPGRLFRDTDFDILDMVSGRPQELRTQKEHKFCADI